MRASQNVRGTCTAPIKPSATARGRRRVLYRRLWCLANISSTAFPTGSRKSSRPWWLMYVSLAARHGDTMPVLCCVRRCKCLATTQARAAIRATTIWNQPTTTRSGRFGAARNLFDPAEALRHSNGIRPQVPWYPAVNAGKSRALKMAYSLRWDALSPRPNLHVEATSRLYLRPWEIGA